MIVTYGFSVNDSMEATEEPFRKRQRLGIFIPRRALCNAIYRLMAAKIGVARQDRHLSEYLMEAF